MSNDTNMNTTFPADFGSQDYPLEAMGFFVYRKEGTWYARDPKCDPDTDAGSWGPVSKIMDAKLTEVVSAARKTGKVPKIT